MIKYRDLKDGDIYWTIEDGKPYWSCFDFCSEELHFEGKLYFEDEEECLKYIKNNH